MLAINEAMEEYNKDLPKDEQLTGKKAAFMLYPEKSESRGAILFSRIRNGHDLSTVTPKIVLALCRVLHTTPNKLFKWKN